MEHKLAPILKQWLAAIKANPNQKQDLLPLKDTDRPVLKLMRLRQCLEHCNSQQASSVARESKETVEQFVAMLIPEIEDNLEISLGDLYLS